MAFTVIETQPKRSTAPIDHGGRSMEEISDDYFSKINPIGRKIISEKRKCMESHRRDWDRLTQKERDSFLDEWFIDPTIQLRYELKLGKKTNAVSASFPRLKVEGGGKVVHYSTDHEDSSNKETVSWKDEFSGPFSWETKCQHELTIMTPETIPATATTVPSPSISHDLIKVSDPADETDAEWFAKAHKDKGKLSVMLMRDVSNRNSLGNNLLASSSERLVFDQAVNEANNSKQSKPRKENIAVVNNSSSSNGEKKSSQGSLEKRKKSPKRERSDKPKSTPPVTAKKNSGSKGSTNSGSKTKEKVSIPSSPRKEKPSKNSEVGSPRREKASKSIEMGSPRRDSGSKRQQAEKKQLLPAALLAEMKQELKVQDNMNFDAGSKRSPPKEAGQGDHKTEEGEPGMEEAASYEFLFDW
ncbi:uncharacterized protein [Asterias amurensis]|uniref:uncharacterized protein n=1 Tax=Asterias amurensis TaxID=7602 RepID=UPI003AB28058